MDASGLIANERARMRMPWAAPSRASGNIGLDFGMEKFNLVQVDRTSGRYEIRAAASVRYPSLRDEVIADPKLLKPLLDDALRSRPFHGRTVVATLPANRVRLMLVNYQCRSDQTEATAVIEAVRSRLGDKVNSTVLDYLPIRPKGDEQVEKTVLVALAERDELIRYLEVLRHCGLKVDAIEVGPIAVKRLICALGESHDEQKVLVITFGTEKSYCTVIWGNALLVDREVDFGMNMVLQSLMDTLDLPQPEAHALLLRHGLSLPGDEDIAHAPGFQSDIAEAITEILKPAFKSLADELQKVLIYTAAETRGGAVEKIYALGSVSRWPHADRLLSKLVGIKVTNINPFYGLEVDDNAALVDDLEPVSGIAVATGLALRGLENHA